MGTSASTVNATESAQDDSAKTSKLNESIEKEYLETGHVKSGYSLRYVPDGKGGTKALIEKV